MSDSLRPKATLANATRDLFSLSGEHRPIMLSLTNEAIDLAPESEPPARDSQASLIFSLKELSSKEEPRKEQESLVDRQLWEMKVETPLFGTANDAALLAAPVLDSGPGSSPMTVAHSGPPEGGESGYLWWLAGAASTVLLGAAVWWGVTHALQPAEAELAAAPARVAQSEPGLDAPPRLEAASEAEPESNTAAPTPGEALASTTSPSAEPAAEPARQEATSEPTRSRSKPRTAKKKTVTKKRRSAPKKKARVAAPRSGPKFDKSAAKSALSGAARRASECNMPGAAGGKGAVVLTFSPEGRVTNARLSAGRFQGTAIGTCVLSEFRRTKVPAFSGKPVTVKKSFRIR